MVRTSRARAVSSGGGLLPAVVAVGAVLIVVAAAGVLYFLGTNQRTEPEVEAEEQEGNPFEGLPPERPDK